MDFDDLTLLIPVRDRHYNLDRVFTHYKDLDCKKIVVDSSTRRYSKEHKAKDLVLSMIITGLPTIQN